MQSYFWEQRPLEISKAIDEQFASIRSKEREDKNWTLYNGDPEYFLVDVKERILIKKILEAECENRKEFFLLDLGAGDFIWNHAMADYLNKLDLPDDVIIHIIGIRGEKSSRESITIHGKCRIYDLGEFKVENMLAEFERHQLHLVNQVDFIVSRACFQHLIDPVGALAQAYELLRPRFGFFAFDNFDHFVIGQDKNEPSIEQVVTMLRESEIKFLMFNSTRPYFNFDFITAKKNQDSCKINLQYSHVSRTPISGSGLFLRCPSVIFRAVTQNKKISLSGNNHADDMFGDTILYEFLKKHKLLNRKHIFKSINQNNLSKTEIQNKVYKRFSLFKTAKYDKDVVWFLSQLNAYIELGIPFSSVSILEKAITIMVYIVRERKNTYENSFKYSIDKYISFLCENGVAINDVDSETKLTPLTAAISHYDDLNVELVEALLKHKANPNIICKISHWLIGDIDISIMQSIVCLYMNPPFSVYSKNKRVDEYLLSAKKIIMLLLDYGIDLNLHVKMYKNLYSSEENIVSLFEYIEHKMKNCAHMDRVEILQKILDAKLTSSHNQNLKL